jgi:hypothetical protein
MDRGIKVQLIFSRNKERGRRKGRVGVRAPGEDRGTERERASERGGGGGGGGTHINFAPVFISET